MLFTTWFLEVHWFPRVECGGGWRETVPWPSHSSRSLQILSEQRLLAREDVALSEERERVRALRPARGSEEGAAGSAGYSKCFYPFGLARAPSPD